MEININTIKNHNLYQKISEASVSPVGNLLDTDTDDTTADAQIKAISFVINKLKKDKISVLEYGTNKGFFIFVLSLMCEKVNGITFEINKQYKQSIDLVLGLKNVDVEVIYDDSTKQGVNYTNYNFDVAWIDGGRTDSVLYHDLYLAIFTKTKYILVDDNKFYGEAFTIKVREALSSLYQEIENPYFDNDKKGLKIYEKR